MRTGEPAFLSRRYQASADDDYRCDLCVNFVCYLIMFLMRARLDIGYYLLHIILPEAVYTIVVAFIFYPLLLLLHKWLWCADRGSTE